MVKTTVALAAAMTLVCARAEAVVYTFTPTAIQPNISPFYTLDTPALTISISDDAVQSGSFNYDYRYSVIQAGTPPQAVYRPVATGDVQALQLFRANGGLISFAGGSGPAGTGSDFFRVNLAFSTTGQITAGALSYGDDAYNVEIAGSGTTFNGLFGLGTQPQSSVVGEFAGSLSSVPEPATLGLLAAALAFVTARQRRR